MTCFVLKSVFENLVLCPCISHLKKTTFYFKTTSKLNAKLEAAAEKVEQFNIEEEGYGLEQSQYPKQREIFKKLQPFHQLYEQANNFHKEMKDWRTGPLKDVNPDAVEVEVSNYWRSMYKFEKTFSGTTPAAMNIAEKTKEAVNDFKELMPVVQAVCNQGLRTRHWEKMSEIVGFQLAPDEESNLEKYIQYDLGQYLVQFETISESATKEFSLEKENPRGILSRSLANYTSS